MAADHFQWQGETCGARDKIEITQSRRRSLIANNGRTVKRARGSRMRTTITLKRPPRRGFILRATIHAVQGDRFTTTRRYKPCR